MSDGYSQDREQVPNHKRGKNFESGTDRFFRDRENGYTPGSHKYEFRDKNGRTERIQFDKIRNEQIPSRTDSIEEKSGRIEGRKDEKQLRGVRELLDRGEINHHTLRSVAGELISKECRELIDGLKRDFPDRFTHLEISRADARAIWAIGQDIERSKLREKEAQGVQLELPGVAAKAREQKSVDLQKRRDKQVTLAKARDAAERLQTVGKFRDAAARGRADAKATPTREVSDADRAKAERDAARKIASQFPAPGELGKARSDANQRVERAEPAPERDTPETAKERVARESAERAAREFPLASELFKDRGPSDNVGHAARETADEAAQQREAEARETARTQAELAKARDEAFRERMEQAQVPEAVRLGLLGQAQDPHAAVREPPGRGSPVVRGGTRQGRGPDRGISPER